MSTIHWGCSSCAAVTWPPGDGSWLSLPTEAASRLACSVARWWHRRLAHVSYFDRATLSAALARSGLEPERWSRPRWYFPVGYLGPRILQYVPGLRRAAPAAERDVPGGLVVPLNLRDSYAVVARPRDHRPGHTRSDPRRARCPARKAVPRWASPHPAGRPLVQERLRRPRHRACVVLLRFGARRWGTRLAGPIGTPVRVTDRLEQLRHQRGARRAVRSAPPEQAPRPVPSGLVNVPLALRPVGRARRASGLGARRSLVGPRFVL